MPTPHAAAMVADLAAITCPVDRALTAGQLADDLTALLHKVRAAALQEARDTGRDVADIARRVGRTPGRIYQMTTTRRTPKDTRTGIHGYDGDTREGGWVTGHTG